jgi:hypothetical protein
MVLIELEGKSVWPKKKKKKKEREKMSQMQRKTKSAQVWRL